MIKHSFAMVFLLILILSLAGAVSAHENETSEISGVLHQTDLNICDECKIHSEELGYNNQYKSSISAVSDEDYFKINDQTTEDMLNEIMDASRGYVAYEDGNLINVDSVYGVFFVRNAESPTEVLCQDNSAHGDAGPIISDNLWQSNSLINGYSDDFKVKSSDFGLLNEMNGLGSAENYPHEFNLPLADTLSVSRDFDDDAFTLKKSDSSDKKASFAVGMADESMGQASSLDFYQIGVNAGKKALTYLKSHGIGTIDYPNLYVYTSAGRIKVNNQNTDDALKGILDTLGSKFNKKHLISADNPSWKDLVFYFTVVKNSKQISYTLKYDSKSAEIVKIGSKVAKIRSYSHNHKTYQSSEISDNITLDETKDTAAVKNSTANTENVSEFRYDFEISQKSDFNLVNTACALLSVLIVCVIFGIGYRKD